MEFKKYDHLKEEKIISDYWIKHNCFKPKTTKLNKKLLILTNSELIIYRPTCINNQNQIYKNNWKLMNLFMQVKGFSCLHNKIYFKEFNNSLFFLNSGGPVSSDPILIELKNKNGFFKILNKNE